MTALHALVLSVVRTTVSDASANCRHSSTNSAHRPPLIWLYTTLVRAIHSAELVSFFIEAISDTDT